MLFSLVTLALSVSSVAAVLPQFLNSNFDNITIGQPFNITFAPITGSTDAITIRLAQGAAGNLVLVSVLTTAASNGYYIWTPSSSLTPGANYALEILQDDIQNYSEEFPIDAAAGSSSSSSSSSSSTSSSTSTTSSSTRPHFFPTPGPGITISPASGGVVPNNGSGYSNSSTLATIVSPTITVLSTSTAGAVAVNGTVNTPTLTLTSTAGAVGATTDAAGAATTDAAGAATTPGAAPTNVSSFTGGVSALGASPLALILCVFCAIMF